MLTRYIREQYRFYLEWLLDIFPVALAQEIKLFVEGTLCNFRQTKG